MPRERTAIDVAAGKLISSIQREWSDEAGTEQGHITEQVMDLAHDLLEATKAGTLHDTLGSRSIADYLGPLWVKRHPAVLPAIEKLESLLVPGQHA
jgi:hypothetical protein